ncbi:MAG: Tol-Pal system beta propeller repeat protein TolB [Bacilli bacterium]
MILLVGRVEAGCGIVIKENRRSKGREFCRALGIIAALLLSFFAWNPAASAKVYIDIDSPAFQKFPVAVQDFRALGEGEDKEGSAAFFADELGKLLEMTGFFRVIPREAFLEDGATAGITAPEIRFGDWLSIGADFLVKGGFEYKDDELVSEFRLFDVVRGSLITGKRYIGRPDDRKTMVLKFAEEILLALVGERGVFDTKIAFVVKKGDNSELYTVSFDGTNMKEITNYETLTILPRWSPEGERLAFVSYLRGNPDSYILHLNSGRREVLTDFPALNIPSSWSPDGKEILMVLGKDGYNDIYVIEMESKRLRRLTHSPSIDVSPSFSPDGSQIVFVSNRSGNPHLFIMDSKGRSVRRITFEGTNNTSPRWSPRGNEIVYVGLVEKRFQLFTIDAEGGNNTQLTYFDGDCFDPSWSPDGRYLVFTLRRAGIEKVCIINSNGVNLRIIEGADSAKNPAWSPRLDSY